MFRAIKPCPPSTQIPKPYTLRGDIARAVLILLITGALGLVVNAFSSFHVAVLDPSGPGAIPQPVERIDCEALGALLAAHKVVLLDVRYDDAWKAGHPAAALHMTLDELESPGGYRKLNLSAEDDIVVMCDSDECSNADRAATILLDYQFKHVRVLYRGWEGYRDCALPIALAEKSGSPAAAAAPGAGH